MLGLLSLPYEVLSFIVGDLEFDDVYNLGKTCKGLKYLLYEEHIAKSIVESKIFYSNEALAARTSGGGHAPNARALRRAAKRREALATASPFVVAAVGVCHAYLYSKGVLCYVLDDRLRILDIHRSARSELVISIPGLLTRALPNIGNNNQGIFQLLYYSDKIVSCVYKTFALDPGRWLIAFHLATRQIIFVEELESTDKIFARHNKQFLYYGTHSEFGSDGYKKWVIHGYDFEARQWFEQKIHLHDMIGSEIGTAVCFEIHDGYFYALSSQNETREIDWTSFYHCIRFPLNSPCRELLQVAEKEKMWRRQHQEGPIDDRWTSLSLDVDEGSGDLRIVEARKEWFLGRSKSQRTYYRTDLKFPDLITDQDMAGPSSYEAQGSMSLPNAPILKLRDKYDNPQYLHAKPRIPNDVHPTNDGGTFPTFTIAKSLLRYYHTSCSTFLDLVDDPNPTDWAMKQRLRIRSGTRYLNPPVRSEDGVMRPPKENLGEALEEMYRVPEVSFWPPAQGGGEMTDREVDKLYGILNPEGALGDVQAVGDERSVVYATGGADGAGGVLVFVGFDPGCKLEGIKQWGGLKRGAGEGTSAIDPEEKEREVIVERKGKGKFGAGRGVIGQVRISITVPDGGNQGASGSAIEGRRGTAWAWKEKAMYRVINRGFYLGLDKPVSEKKV